MAKSKSIVSVDEIKEILQAEPDFLKTLITKLIQDVLEAEMEEALQAQRARGMAAVLATEAAITAEV